MKTLCAIALSAIAIFSFPAHSAPPPTQALGVCLGNAMTGKDRKDMAAWIFFSFSRHPDFVQYTTASEATIDENNKVVGALVTKLLAEDCAPEARAANEASPVALQMAFEFVGRLAMSDVMSNYDVSSAISKHMRYVDSEKISKALNN